VVGKITQRRRRRVGLSGGLAAAGYGGYNGNKMHQEHMDLHEPVDLNKVSLF